MPKIGLQCCELSTETGSSGTRGCLLPGISARAGEESLGGMVWGCLSRGRRALVTMVELAEHFLGARTPTA